MPGMAGKTSIDMAIAACMYADGHDEAKLILHCPSPTKDNSELVAIECYLSGNNGREDS